MEAKRIIITITEKNGIPCMSMETSKSISGIEILGALRFCEKDVWLKMAEFAGQSKLPNPYELFCRSAMQISINASDFFGYAVADAVQIDCEAVMSFIRQQQPLQEYKTDKFNEALQ